MKGSLNVPTFAVDKWDVSITPEQQRAAALYVAGRVPREQVLEVLEMLRLDGAE